MIYAGGGIISGNASDELLEFAERSQIPVATTLMGIGGFPEGHPLSLKWLGMHGTVYANCAVNESDLLLALGVRFDDRVTGKVEKFAEHGTIVHVDIDFSELNKNKVVKLPVLSDIKYALGELNRLLGGRWVSARFQAVQSFSRLAREDLPMERALSVGFQGHRRSNFTAACDPASV